jgi:hypothetical protein
MMRLTVWLVAACAVLASPTLAGEAAEAAGPEEAAEAAPAGPVVKELSPRAREAIVPSTLDGPVTYQMKNGDKVLALDVSPDGLVRVSRTEAQAMTDIGARGNRAIFTMRPGEEISTWAMREVSVLPWRDGFRIRGVPVDWAFALVADETRPGGLPVDCDGAPCTLRKGARLDTDMKDGKIVFRLTEKTWPGEIVTKKPDDRDRRRRPITGPRPEPTWSNMPLPVIPAEVFRPADVSP